MRTGLDALVGHAVLVGGGVGTAVIYPLARALRETGNYVSSITGGRTKDQVATELPPKTEIIHSIPLHKAQVDLYETVRAAMDKRIRDIIAEKGNEIVFVEVKTRFSEDYGQPWEAVKSDKRRKICNSADQYIRMHQCDQEPRFDIISIVHSNHTTKITHLESAFRPTL